MSDYLGNTIGRTLWGGVLLIGVPVALAWVLQGISERISSIGAYRSLLGFRAYWYFVAIGIACHETGHAVGTWITGNRVTQFVPFAIGREDAPRPGLLGWMRHTTGGIFGVKISETIISTGPIWFGSILILLLTRFLVGHVMDISFHDYFANGELPGIFAYLVACLRCALLLSCELIGGALFSGWKIFLWAYLVFCIASEMRMSNGDLKDSRDGLVRIIGVVLILLFLPFVGKWIALGVATLLPKLFIVHVLMLLAVIINTGFLFLERFLVRVI